MADRIRNYFNKIEFVHMKAHYFLFNAAIACCIPFLAVYAKQLGISALSVGLIFTVMPFLSMIAKPLVGGIADRTKQLSSIVHFFITATSLASICIVFIPKKDLSLPSRIICTSEGSFFFYKTEPISGCIDKLSETKNYICQLTCGECTLTANGTDFFNITAGLDCDISEDYPSEMNVFYSKNASSEMVLFNVTKLMLRHRSMNVFCFSRLYFSCLTACDPEIQNCFIHSSGPDYTSKQLWLFSLLAVLIQVSAGITVSLSDTACFTTLGDRPHLYGRQRLWGTIGWGIFAASAGAINDLVTGDSPIHCYYPGFSIVALLLFIDLFTINNFQNSSVKHSSSILKDISKLMKKPNILMFLCSVFVIGALTGVFWSYLFWHLRMLDASSSLLGVASAVQCLLGELPFFFFAGFIISKIGHFNTLTINLVSFGARFVAYSYLTNPWYVLPIELLQGPTFGLFYATMASYANIAALPGTEATMQGLVGGTFEGLGVAVGSLLSGFVMEKFQGSIMFFWAGIIALSYSIINVIFTICITCKNKFENKPPVAMEIPTGEVSNERTSFL